ncbi:putative Prepilin-type N-terminal cleavage/methylation domain-containing protein [Candidatus Xenohaliotis californiensis]|uniref:Prepilin-type N-terminal cleavage/methylation domain-containing protein n=1 Tax=Candidatus Xenohaliotis californiensis TaxID=84677 RepID=A0ABP0EUA8_9RICK|nr:putative Prepilin-type N-terminal cleavage/methylation domain-containing protein [Candidatus Xenohaliotis californiensis]
MTYKNKTALSIVELVVVLTILGLLTTIITASKVLIQQARIQSAISQLLNVESSIYTFQLSYGFKPGDFPDAISWGTDICNLTGGTDGLNGNGNGRISNDETSATAGFNDAIVESYATWCHLYTAQLTPYDITPLTNKNTIPERNTNIAPSVLNDSAILHIAYDSDEKKNVIYIAEPTLNMDPLNSALTPSEANSIDNKLDNKRADRGRIIGVKGDDATEECLKSNNKKYDLSVNEKTCYIKYVLTH